MVCNGAYKDEATAAHASDTLARNFEANGEHGHKFNFPNDHTEVWPEEVISNMRTTGSGNAREGSNSPTNDKCDERVQFKN